MKKISLAAVLFICVLALFIGEVDAQGAKTFHNPIIAGFYPDPSICRVGDDYYLVNSTFSYFPGITVFHSKDLVHWELIGYVLNRPEQFNLDGQAVSRGIFAPAIRYHNGTFYVTCTLVDIGGNFVATAKNPAGPWSDPVWLPQINGIDPCLFFDDDASNPADRDKAYILYNSVAPDDKPLYEGHRTIRMYAFNPKTLSVTGYEHLLVNGGTDLSKKPIWIEGPHILHKDQLYYLIAAEGGTADQHSEVVFRSEKVGGPYVPYKQNPILTQRHLDPKRKFPITCAGHADFVQTVAGDWWAVFLGSRPYEPVEEGYVNTGRETFLAPVRWNDGWPAVDLGSDVVQYSYPLPVHTSDIVGTIRGGNIRVRDNFDKPVLDINWAFLRTPHTRWYDFSQKPGFITLLLRPESCDGTMNPSFLGRRQQHLYGTAATALEFIPQAENEKAGLVIFHNEEHFYYLCKSLDQGNTVVQLFQSGKAAKPMELLASAVLEKNDAGKRLFLKVEAKGNSYSFSFGTAPDQWILLKEPVDARFVSTRVAGGFIGCLYGLYATSLGNSSSAVASYDWFETVSNDPVYQ